MCERVGANELRARACEGGCILGGARGSGRVLRVSARGEREQEAER
jgi:hypothetical protein